MAGIEPDQRPRRRCPAPHLAILAALPIELLTAASLDSFPGMLLYVPGGLFELFLPILLIARGFRRTDAPAVDAAGEHGSALAAA